MRFDRFSFDVGLQQYGIAPVSLYPLLEFMRSAGHDPRIACDGLGVSCPDFDTPEFRVTHSQACNIVRRALRILGDPNPGFMLGQRANLASRGILALGLLASRNLSDAFELAAQYPQEAGYLVAVRLERSGLRGYTTLEPIFGSLDILPFLVELTATGIVRCARILSNAVCTPLAIEFSHLEHKYRIEEYEEFFGCPVRFNANANRMFFDERFLATPIPSSHLASLRLAKNLLDQGKHGATKLVSTGSAVATIVSRNIGASFNAATVARILCISERSLRRRLMEEGSNFQLIVDECRANYVISRLAVEDLSISELAAQTGFRDMRAFRRAFKRWTGCSFTQYKTGSPRHRGQGRPIPA